MGITKTFSCPVEGCTYSSAFRFGMGEETSNAAHAEREEILRTEHPDHPVPEDEQSDAKQA
jgi:hypothetical protein